MEPTEDSTGARHDRAVLVASLTKEASRADLAALSGVAGILEVRADLLGTRAAEVDVEALRADFAGELLFTLRSRDEGGEFGGVALCDRHEELIAAAERFDLVDLEADRDLDDGVLAAVPVAKRLVSWHGPAAEVSELRERLEAMLRVPARYYKLVTAAESAKDGLAPLALLHAFERNNVTAFSMGAAGFWTRLLAPRLGAPLVFGAAADPPDAAAAPAQPSIRRLVADFGLPDLRPVEGLFGVVGNPALHSLSPRLHNAAYRDVGLDALYLPFEIDVFGDFWLDVAERGSLALLGFRLAGLSVTAPFKEIALAVSGATSPLAERVGSANTLIRRGEVWEAESTDAEGLCRPLEAQGVELAGKKAAIVGAGGAGRAAAFGLGGGGAEVTMVNRSRERGARVARELGVDFLNLDEFEPGDFDVVVNATPLGKVEGEDLPFDPARLGEGAWLIDLAYLADRPTFLVREAQRLGAGVIEGREVLLHQAVPQFRLMTGEEMSLDVGRGVLGLPNPVEGG